MVQARTGPIPFPTIKLGLFTADRHLLHVQIENRFRQMLEQGLVDEVETVVAGIDHPDKQPSMRIVGYRQVRGYLKKEFGYDEMIEKGIAATRQLAKRQLTWLRQQNNLVWINITHPRAADSVPEYLRNRLELCGQVI
jgi:tRNA dimethylallyltransferase